MRTNWLASIWRCYSRQSKRGQITGAIPLPGLPASARARSLLRQYQECYDPAAVRPEREPAHPNPTILQTRAPESRNAVKGCKTLILFEKSNSLNISALHLRDHWRRNVAFISSTIRAPTACQVRFFVACTRTFLRIEKYLFLSAQSSSIRLANASAVRGGSIRKPVTPSSTNSGIPKLLAAIEGQP